MQFLSYITLEIVKTVSVLVDIDTYVVPEVRDKAWSRSGVLPTIPITKPPKRGKKDFTTVYLCPTRNYHYGVWI